MTRLVLYTRPGCHLCDDALLMVEQISGAGPVESCDISGDLTLLSSYGARLPVFKRVSDGAELGWPFSEAELEEFVR